MDKRNIEPDRKKWDHSNEGPIVVTCSHCGSAGVTRDATVRWDIESQKWELSGIFDQGDCDICGETRLEDTPLDEWTGDACVKEPTPNGKCHVGAQHRPAEDIYTPVAWYGEGEIAASMRMLASRHTTAQDAKDAARLWLFEKGHM